APAIKATLGVNFVSLPFGATVHPAWHWHRRERAGFLAALQGEALVIIRYHFVTYLSVLIQSGDIRHEHARLARYVRAGIPRVSLRIERRVRNVVHVRDPTVLCAFIRFDMPDLLIPEILQAIGDPVDVLL